MSLISKRSRYALHGLAFMSVRAGAGHMPLDEILGYLRDYSSQLTLSPGYIAKIFQQISRSGLTEAVPGPRGGYRLARPPAQIRLIEVLESLEGPMLTQCCLLSVGDCTQTSKCGVRGVIHEAELSFYRFFEKETVASLARRMSFPEPPRPVLGKAAPRARSLSPGRKSVAGRTSRKVTRTRSRATKTRPKTTKTRRTSGRTKPGK